VRIEPAPVGKTLSAMLAAGEIDALIAPRAPSCFLRGEPNVAWLFADARAAASDWFTARVCSRSCTLWAYGVAWRINIPGCQWPY
jgi:hypothetical protein